MRAYPSVQQLLAALDQALDAARAAVERRDHRSAPTLRADLRYIPLFHDAMVVAVAAGIAAPAARLSFGDLPRMSLFWLRRKDNPMLHDTAEQVFTDHGYAPERRPKPEHRDTS